MATFATAQYPAPNAGEAASAQLSDQDLDKLQEIHELINLMIRDLPVMAQATARSYITTMPPAAPYAYSFYQFPWGRMPLLPPQGI